MIFRPLPIFTFCLCLLYAAPLTASYRMPEPTLKAELETRALQYFLHEANPATGLVRDSAENFSTTPASNTMASIAATGFSLAVIANAASRGMVDYIEAYAYTLKTLRFAVNKVPRRKGWFLHFTDWRTGARFGNSEYSTIDTALFVAGALYAGQIFPNSEVTKLAQQIYADLDFFDMLTDGGTQPNKNTLSMGYFPGTGYTKAQWSMPAEQKLLLLLGLGHPTHPLPASLWLSWSRDETTLPDGETLIGANMPLFVHQYSELFVDFRQFSDHGINYYDQGRIATNFNRQSCLDDNQFQTTRAGFWGLSAGFAPHDGYGANEPTHPVSTVCLGCVVASAMYEPNLVLDDIAAWLNGPYKQKIWGKYGLTDSIDLDQSWFSQEVLGITVGPLFLSLANMSADTSIWKDFNAIPQIQTALHEAMPSASAAAHL